MKILYLVIIATSLAACASPERELKAPCKAVTNYVADSSCGPLKPANAAIEEIMAE